MRRNYALNHLTAKAHMLLRLCPLALVAFGLLLAHVESRADFPATSHKEVYVYDDLNRLVQVQRDDGTATTYNYDAVGNILSVEGTAGSGNAPIVNSIVPATAARGASVSVRITGTNFANAALKIANPGIHARNVVVAATTVDAIFDIDAQAQTGATSVTVESSLGSVQASFNITAAIPILTTLSPTQGPVTRIVRLDGRGFSAIKNENAVTFSGIPAPVLSSTHSQLVTQVPSGATSGNVIVTSNGLATAGLPFTVVASGLPPQMTNITPTIASVDGGTLVTVSGLNFNSDTQVLINGVPVSGRNVLNSTTISGLVPPSSRAGSADVVVSNANGDAIAVGAFTYVLERLIRLESVSPVGLAPTNLRVSMLFSEPVDPTTVSASSVYLTDTALNPIAGAFSFAPDNRAIHLKPSALLTAGQTYRIVVTQEIKSAHGVALNAPYVGFITTSSGQDNLRPKVTIIPPNDAADVPYNNRVLLEFNEEMDASTLNPSSVLVTNDGVSKNGTVSVSQDRRNASFIPLAPFTPKSLVEIKLTSEIADFAGNSLDGTQSGNIESRFRTATNQDILPPRVLSVYPRDGSAGVSQSSTVSATFSEPVDPATVNASTFTVQTNGADVPGTITVDGTRTVATYRPATLLPLSTTVTLAVTAEIRDFAGNGLSLVTSSSFVTESSVDIIRPVVVSYTPAASRSSVSLDAVVEVVFDEAIDGARLDAQSVSVTRSGIPVDGTRTLSADRKRLVFRPSLPLVPGTYNSVRVSRDHIFDIAGNALLSDESWSFYTGVDVHDTNAPQVTAVSPKDGATGFSTNGVVELYFNEVLAPTSVTDQSIVISANGVPVAGELTLADGGSVVKFKPANLFLWANSTVHEIQVTAGVRDVAGNGATPFNSVFTTSAVSDSQKPTIVSITPADNSVVDPNQLLVFTVTFNEAINLQSAQSAVSVTMGYYGSGALSRTLSLSANGTVLTITVSEPRVANQLIRLNVTTAVRDLAGNDLAASSSKNVTTAWSAPADSSTQFNSATITFNPGTLRPDGQSTAQVRVSGISRNGVLVPNGTKVAVTVAPIFQNDSVGGSLLEGDANTYDARVKMFTTLGGEILFTYQSPNLPGLSGSKSAYVQVAPVDALGRMGPSVTDRALSVRWGKQATITTNPAQLRADGVSYADVDIDLLDSDGNPLPIGSRIGVTVEKVYESDSVGGTLSGGIESAQPAQDPRVKIYEIQAGGRIALKYTAPVLAVPGTATIQVLNVNELGQVTEQLVSRSINVSPTNTITHPQAKMLWSNPAQGQSAVGTNASVQLAFSQSLDPTTVNASNFNVSGFVPSSYTLSEGPGGPNSVVTLTHAAALPANNSFYISPYSGLNSADGQPLASTYSFSFSTGPGADVTAPNVVAFNPRDGANGVPTNVRLKVYFSEPVNVGTLTGVFTLTDGTTPISVRAEPFKNEAGVNSAVQLIPSQALLPNSTYTLSVAAGKVKDSAGLTAAGASISFVTGNDGDVIAPIVLLTTPTNGALASLDLKPQITFNEPIDPTTVCCDNVTLGYNYNSGRVPVTVVFNGTYTVMTLQPKWPLFAGTQYQLFVSPYVRDVSGNALLNGVSLGFRTDLAAGSVNIADSASVLVNPPDMVANGNNSAEIRITNVTVRGATAPNGTRIGITAEPVFDQSVGGQITGASVGLSPDPRFVVFETIGGDVTANFTPADLALGATAKAKIQIVSVDAENNPIALLGTATVNLTGN